MRSLFASLSVVLVTIAASPLAVAGPQNARRCADFTQRLDRENKAVYFVLRNRCEEAVTCELSWQTRCDKGTPTPHDDRATVKGKDQHEFYAPTQCTEEQSWEVTSAKWTCN